MKDVLPLFVFIDACGWEIIKDQPFLKSLAVNRRRLTSVFGYSSACVPSIVSGAWPCDHRNWCYFVYDPKNSPFKGLRFLRYLPATLSSRRRVRRYISKIVRAQLNFRGYFDLYNIPFRDIGLFDFSEKKSPLKPGGMNRGDNIFDFLEKRDIPYHVSEPSRPELHNLAAVSDAIRSEVIDFAFVYLPALDGLMHMVGNKSPKVGEKLHWYEEQLQDLMAVAGKHYEEVRLYVFSDHGMANCDVHVDLKSKVDALPLRMGVDYAVVYDSTMARFWFFNDAARKQVQTLLQSVPQGRVLPDDELKEMGTYFPDHYFGELIFLMQEGALIVPSFMGQRPIPAMHGYHPTDPQSYAALLTNQTNIPSDITDIPHMYRLMKSEAEQAHANNQFSPSFQHPGGRVLAVV